MNETLRSEVLSYIQALNNQWHDIVSTRTMKIDYDPTKTKEFRLSDFIEKSDEYFYQRKTKYDENIRDKVENELISNFLKGINDKCIFICQEDIKYSKIDADNGVFEKEEMEKIHLDLEMGFKYGECLEKLNNESIQSITITEYACLPYFIGMVKFSFWFFNLKVGSMELDKTIRPDIVHHLLLFEKKQVGEELPTHLNNLYSQYEYYKTISSPENGFVFNDFIIYNSILAMLYASQYSSNIKDLISGQRIDINPYRNSYERGFKIGVHEFNSEELPISKSGKKKYFQTILYEIERSNRKGLLKALGKCYCSLNLDISKQYGVDAGYAYSLFDFMKKKSFIIKDQIKDERDSLLYCMDRSKDINLKAEEICTIVLDTLINENIFDKNTTKSQIMFLLYGFEYRNMRPIQIGTKGTNAMITHFMDLIYQSNWRSVASKNNYFQSKKKKVLNQNDFDTAAQRIESEQAKSVSKYKTIKNLCGEITSSKHYHIKVNNNSI